MPRYNPNIPQAQFVQNPQPQASPVDAIMQGLERGQSLGLRQRQQALLEQESADKQKQVDLQTLKVFGDQLETFKKSPKAYEQFFKSYYAPAAEKALGQDFAVDIDSFSFDNENDLKAGEEYKTITQNVVNGTTSPEVAANLLTRVLASYNASDDIEKQIQETAKFYSNQANSSSKDNRLDALEEQRRERRISDFRDRLTSSNPYKAFSETKKRTESLSYAAENPGAFGDLGILYDYMKALDPESVVREGEQLMFRKTGSISQYLANSLNKLANGQTLQPEQREAIIKYANNRYRIALDMYDAHRTPTYNQSKRLGLPIEDIDPFYDIESKVPSVSTTGNNDLFNMSDEELSEIAGGK